jgi:hypothetical protein
MGRPKGSKNKVLVPRIPGAPVHRNTEAKERAYQRTRNVHKSVTKGTGVMSARPQPASDLGSGEYTLRYNPWVPKHLFED